MISLEHKEATQKKSEAQTAGLQIQGYPYALPRNGSPLEGFLELKDDVFTQSTGNILEPERSLNNELLNSSIEFNKKPTHFGSWSPTHPDFHKTQLCQWNGFQSPVYPYSVDNRVQYAPFSVFPQNHPADYQYQEFHYFVVIDFEATCDKEKIPHPQEIIEFPSVIVSSVTGQLEACFQTYVRPTCNQLLSDFCKDLTGIQQIQVDRGVTLSEALLRHDKWLEKKGIKNTNFAVVTWSNWDCKVMLESECRYKKIRKPPYFNRWINLKVPFREVFGGMRCNLKEAVQLAGLTWQGRPHCGLDDAKNTARLLSLLMQRGFKFSITNSMMCQATADQSFTWKHQQPPVLEHRPSPPHHRPSPPHHHPSPPHHHPHGRALHFPPVFHPYCHCGVRSSKGMVRKPGPKQGSCFFGCGNWTATRGARCQYFEWVSPPLNQ